MKYKIKHLFMILVLVLGSNLYSQSIQVGINNSGNTLEIYLVPDTDFNALFSGFSITIRWRDSYGVSLGTVTTSLGVYKNLGETISNIGGTDYRSQEFVSFHNSTVNWLNGNQVSLFTVPVEQTGTGTGEFELVSGDYYIELGGIEYTNSVFVSGTTNNVPLPVELTTFKVNSVEGVNAQLSWETATEVNNYGFEVERAIKTEIEDGIEETEAEIEWENIAFVEGHGNSNSPKLYSFKDESLVGGSKFLYRLKQIDLDGTFEYSDIVEVEVLPNKYELLQNYPNPFNPSTKIRFSLPEDTKLAINIYNILGEKVFTLLNKELKAGFHQIQFNSKSAGYRLASGVYVYTLESKNFTQVKKMILLK